MDIESLHLKYSELNKDDVIKEGDSVNFTEVKPQIDRMYAWEKDYYEASDYRGQLPEDTLRSIENEFSTVIKLFEEIINLRARDIPSLAQQRQDKVNSIKNLYRTIYNTFVQDFRGWQIENEGNSFTRKLQEVAKQAGEELEQRVKEGGKESEQKSAEVVQKIVGAKSTDEWAKEYLLYIAPDQSIENKLVELKKDFKQQTKAYLGARGFLKTNRSYSLYVFKRFWIAKIQGAALYSGDSYHNISNRWRFWRSLAYLTLVGIALYYFVHTLLLKISDGSVLFNFFLQKITFLPLVTVIAVGLAFASKNFRINLNLLEEYRHRYVVSKTIQNLLLLPENGPLRVDLLIAGTDILFEHRATGYMDNDKELALLDKLLSQPNISILPNEKR